MPVSSSAGAALSPRLRVSFFGALSIEASVRGESQRLGELVLPRIPFHQSQRDQREHERFHGCRYSCEGSLAWVDALRSRLSACFISYTRA